MSLPKSPLAYADCQEFLDLAMGDAQGARRFIGADYQPASYFRFRCLNYRVLDREANARLYPEGHKMHGMSIYDNLYLTIEQDTENNFWVYAQKRILPAGEIETLSEANNGN